MDLSAVKHTVKIISTISKGCPYCGKFQEGEQIDECVNHLLLEHGGTLLHVGSEAFLDERGATAHATVAVVGTAEVPPKREPTAFNINIVRPPPGSAGQA